MRNLVEGLSWASGWSRVWTVPTKAALFKARARLGPEPMAALFDAVAVPLATSATRGAFYRDWRLMSIDGTCLDVADTPANEEAFGRPGSSRGEGVGAFPQVRLVGVAECGTHALVEATLGGCTTGEPTLARDVVDSLGPAMLLIADRGFYSFSLWNQARATGAQLLWRTKSNHVLPVVERLDDGSYLSTLHEIVNYKRRPEGIPVRVVEYTIDDPGRPQEARRLASRLRFGCLPAPWTISLSGVDLDQISVFAGSDVAGRVRSVSRQARMPCCCRTRRRRRISPWAAASCCWRSCTTVRRPARSSRSLAVRTCTTLPSEFSDAVPGDGSGVWVVC